MRFFSFYLIGAHAIFSDVNTIALVSFLCERSATLINKKGKIKKHTSYSSYRYVNAALVGREER
jgi:hypothetical protein